MKISFTFVKNVINLFADYVSLRHTLRALIRDSTFSSTMSLIVFPCPMMARTVASTAVLYVFVVPSITFALERTLSTLESKYLDISKALNCSLYPRQIQIVKICWERQPNNSRFIKI
jgi:hypothetical protein